MATAEKVLLSPVRHVSTHLYGYNFYEGTVGFGNAREIPIASGYYGIAVTLTDQDDLRIELPAERRFAFRMPAAQEVIARAINEAQA
jgi:hypothetical protein